jgi:hypothetical protein
MLYLKNTFGGLSRTLTDTALHTFHGSHRWWKLALYAAMFVLPGGSLGVLLLAWIEHRRARRSGQADAAAAERQDALGPAVAGRGPGAAAASLVPGASVCQSRGNAPVCRAAAGKLARQSLSERV